MKNIVICFDIDRKFGLLQEKSNSLKFYSALTRDELQLTAYVPIPALTIMEKKGISKAIESMTKFDPVGSFLAIASLLWDLPEVKTMKRLFAGNGMALQLQAALEVVRSNYCEGDRLFIFGFSWAASAALLFASFLQRYGIPSSEFKEDIPAVMAIFFESTRKNQLPDTAFFKKNFSRECAVSFLGMWECMSTVGWIYSPVNLNSLKTFGITCPVRHAVAIDERRSLYRPLLFSPSDDPFHGVKQVWFAGVHADIGGSYLESQSGLSNLALEWMIDEAAAAGIRMDEDGVESLLGRRDANIGEQPREGSAMFLHRSLRGPWWVFETIPFRYNEDGQRISKFLVPLGARRRIPNGALMHSTVGKLLENKLHLDNRKAYSPPNLRNGKLIPTVDDENPPLYIYERLVADKNRSSHLTLISRLLHLGMTGVAILVWTIVPLFYLWLIVIALVFVVSQGHSIYEQIKSAGDLILHRMNGWL